MTTTFTPNKVAPNPNSKADLDIFTALISKNQSLYGAITARSYHLGGVNALSGDASVRFVKSTIDGSTWRDPRDDPRRRGHQLRPVLRGVAPAGAIAIVRSRAGPESHRHTAPGLTSRAPPSLLCS